MKMKIEPIQTDSRWPRFAPRAKKRKGREGACCFFSPGNIVVKKEIHFALAELDSRNHRGSFFSPSIISAPRESTEFVDSRPGIISCSLVTGVNLSTRGRRVMYKPSRARTMELHKTAAISVNFHCYPVNCCQKFASNDLLREVTGCFNATATSKQEGPA